jgi:hypothetical protein
MQTINFPKPRARIPRLRLYTAGPADIADSRLFVADTLHVLLSVITLDYYRRYSALPLFVTPRFLYLEYAEIEPPALLPGDGT